MKTIDNTNSPIETHFEQVHSIIHLHRSRALQVVNNESLLICWNVGQYVSEKLRTSDWGNKVVTQLSEYLCTNDPSLKGYSRRNIYNMVAFFEYSSQKFLQLLSSIKIKKQFLQNVTAQFIPMQEIPQILLFANWSMHVEIINKCKLPEEKIFYILYAQRENLNYRELQRAIKTNAYANGH